MKISEVAVWTDGMIISAYWDDTFQAAHIVKQYLCINNSVKWDRRGAPSTRRGQINKYVKKKATAQ